MGLIGFMTKLIIMEIPSDNNDYFQNVSQIISRNKYVIILVLLNFITNFLFIFQYKFYSDDWSTIVKPFMARDTYLNLILYPDRPIYYTIFKFQAQIFQDYTLIYHIFGFVTTSIILVLIYKIAQKLFSDFQYNAEIYPFLAAVIYCVLFNKDELYPFALVALGFYSIMYLLSFYTYIYKERKNYLIYSLITYTLGLFTYENGIALPVIFLGYDILLKKDYKKSFLFAIPLVFNLVVRKTSWFGYGSTVYSNGFGQWGFQSLLQSVFDFLSASVFIIFRQILYAFQGLQTMGVLIICIAIINLVILIILYKFIDFSRLTKVENTSLGFLLLIIIAAFAFPYILRGGLLSGSLPTRSFEFIDIGVALLLTFIIIYLPKPRLTKILILVFIGICIFVCQGLFMNWVVSGDIQEEVYRFIGEHSDEIKSYDYLYFNTPSFVINKPNAINESVFYPVAKLYFQYIRKDPHTLENRISAQTQQLKYNNEYDRYYNAKGLDNYALASMLSTKIDKFDDRNYSHYLIYGKTLNVPVEITQNFIVFQQQFPNGQNITIEKSRIYEINHDKVYPVG